MTQEALSLSEPSREGIRDRVLALRAQRMFATLDDDGLLILAEHARSASYREGEVIVPEGELVPPIVVVVEGSVELSIGGKVLVTMTNGDTFGALTLLARTPSSVAVAQVATRTLEIPGRAFETALDESYSLLRGALAVFGGLALQSRGNLPADPSIERKIDEGVYYTEPKSMVERLIQLRGSGFGYMNLEALIDLARHMMEVRYEAGDVLWRPEIPATHSLTIDSGRVRCTAPDGRHVDVGCDFSIGTLDAWGVRRRAYDAHAETRVIAYRVSFESFLTLLEAHVEVGVELLRGFALAIVNERKPK